MSENGFFNHKFKIYASSLLISTIFIWSVRSAINKHRMEKKKEEIKLKSDIQA